MSDQTEESKALLRRITDEIWTQGRFDLIEELVAENFTDYVDMPGLESSRRERYRASVAMIREAFPDYREDILWLVGEGDRAVSFVRKSGTHQGILQGIEPHRPCHPMAFDGSLTIRSRTSGRTLGYW